MTWELNEYPQTSASQLELVSIPKKHLSMYGGIWVMGS